MSLTMHILVFVLVGFTHIGHAHKAWRLVNDLHAEAAKPAEALASVLLGLNPLGSFNPSSPSLGKPLSQRLSRRGAIGTAAAALLSSFATQPATAAEDNIEVYFGCGCFWHVQHEFVEAEKKILGRGDLQLTALSGYAGGNGGMKDGKVCYHNAMQMSDYGSLGHAEVVRLSIPPTKFKEFASEYFALFDAKGYRADQFWCRGLEYRSVVGIPGGEGSPLVKDLMEVSKATGDKLDFAIGKGSDNDVPSTAFVMDSTKFPFYQAEPYHQFHDGFNWNENYPDSYNGLTSKLLREKVVKDQGCPAGFVGIGVAGL